MNADELVSQWVVSDFRRRSEYQHLYGPYVSNDEEHLSRCIDLTFTSHSHEWECGCYSTYTRDDSWSIRGTISCPHGTSIPYWTTASEWDSGLPGVIKEMIDLDGQDFTCPVDERNDED